MKQRSRVDSVHFLRKTLQFEIKKYYSLVRKLGRKKLSGNSISWPRIFPLGALSEFERLFWRIRIVAQELVRIRSERFESKNCLQKQRLKDCNSLLNVEI